MLLSGRTPFFGSDENIFAMIRSGKIDFPKEDWNNVSKEG